jgi:hypothetical protein
MTYDIVQVGPQTYQVYRLSRLSRAVELPARSTEQRRPANKKCESLGKATTVIRSRPATSCAGPATPSSGTLAAPRCRPLTNPPSHRLQRRRSYHYEYRHCQEPHGRDTGQPRGLPASRSAMTASGRNAPSENHDEV